MILILIPIWHTPDEYCTCQIYIAVLSSTLEAATNCTLRNLGLEHTDMLLEDENTTHVLLALLDGDHGHMLYDLH